MTPSEQLSIDRFAHDIRGPLSNLKGFSSELECSINQLVACVNSYKGQLPEEFRKEINAIIDDDVYLCLSYSHSSIEKIGTRLEQFEASSKDGTNVA